MDNIIDSTSGIVQSNMDLAKNSLVNAWENHDHTKDFSEVIKETFANIPKPFSALRTNYLQTTFIKKNLNYVEIKEVVLGKKISVKHWKNKRVLVEKDETFIYIPIVESLRQLLSNKKVAKLVIKKPSYCDSGVYYDICDGELFKNDPFFMEHQDAIQIIIYHDAVEVCNPLGSHAGLHKLDMFYYTIGNLNPKVRSKHCAVRLLGIANAKLVKKYGHNAILRPVIEDIHKLENGCPFVVNGREKVIFGKVISCAGDTEGQHEWGGYKVGVGFAFHKCRHCQCHYDAMQRSFYDYDFHARSKETHERHCKEIDEAPTEHLKNDLKTTYGINHRSSLCDLHDFDITTQLPQDIMHTLLEGVVQYELRHILAHYISTGEFTLAQLNAAITSQCYGYSEVSDKPDALRESVFQAEERYKLKYNAAQARLFLRLIPFILCSLVSEDDLVYPLITELLAICQIVFSPVISLETINLLRLLIGEHLAHFKERFPEINITPKQHYLIHLPKMIKLLGPLVRHSCFSFESAHNYFKELARKQNFKNLAKSLAERCQLKECSNFGDLTEDARSHPLFSSERKYGSLSTAGESVKRNLREHMDSCGLMPGIKLQNVYKVTWVVCHGTDFRKSGVIMYDIDKDLLSPMFGVIKQIWIVSDFIYLEHIPFETLCFSDRFQAYHVRKTVAAETVITSYESLVDFNVFHYHEDSEGESYVPVKYDIGDLIEQHAKGENPLKF